MEKEVKKKKLPTAKKRMIQNEKRRHINNIRKAKVKSSIKTLSLIENHELAVKNNKKTSVVPTVEKSVAVFKSQKEIDKAAKTGAISEGRANRLKSKIYKKYKK